MAATDALADLLDIARREAPDIPDDVWARIDRSIRVNYGTQRLYIAAHRKRLHLETIAEAHNQAGNDQLAERLGITDRRVRQLRSLLDDK